MGSGAGWVKNVTKLMVVRDGAAISSEASPENARSMSQTAHISNLTILVKPEA